MKTFISEALTERSKYYPPQWDGHVPKRVRMRETVRPEFLFLLNGVERKKLVCWSGQVFDVVVNSHGAVAAIFPELEKTLGLKPEEFEVIEWHEVLADAR